MILCLFFIASLSNAAPKKKPSDEPVIKEIATIGDAHIVTGFSSIAEYRDYISIIIGVIMFGAREWYQYKRDKERLGALEKGREEDSKKINEMAKSQADLVQAFNLFAKAYERDEERLDRRISRLEIGGKG